MVSFCHIHRPYPFKHLQIMTGQKTLMIVDQLVPSVSILDLGLFRGVVSNSPLLPAAAQRLNTRHLLMQQQNYSGFNNLPLNLVF